MFRHWFSCLSWHKAGRSWDSGSPGSMPERWHPRGKTSEIMVAWPINELPWPFHHLTLTIYDIKSNKITTKVQNHKTTRPWKPKSPTELGLVPGLHCLAAWCSWLHFPQAWKTGPCNHCEGWGTALQLCRAGNNHTTTPTREQQHLISTGTWMKHC